MFKWKLSSSFQGDNMNKLALLCAAAMLLTYVPAANADCGEAGCKSGKECKSGAKKHHKKDKASATGEATGAKDAKPADAAPATDNAGK
jgi:hypothetical protein